MGNEMMSMGMGPAAVPGAGGALTAPDASRAIAEVQGAVLMARMYPRDESVALKRIRNACSRRSLAEVAAYQYSRGGQDITGPSIRLAEVLAQAWGNLQFGIRELSQEGGRSVVEAYSWDVETNTRSSKVFVVEHKRKARGSIRTLDDPRDIYEMVANQGARRLRACLLAVIPGDVVEMAMEECHRTLETSVDLSPEAVERMVEAFRKWGVTAEMIQERIGRSIKSIRPRDMAELRRIAQSIKDGVGKPADFFRGAAVESAKDGKPGKATPDDAAAAAKAKGKASKPRKTKATAPEPEEPPPPTDEDAPPEEPDEGSPEPSEVDKLRARAIDLLAGMPHERNIECEQDLEASFGCPDISKASDSGQLKAIVAYLEERS